MAGCSHVYDVRPSGFRIRYGSEPVVPFPVRWGTTSRAKKIFRWASLLLRCERASGKDRGPLVRVVKDAFTMTAAGEHNLPERAARGDVGAFARLVQEHSGLVYRVALRILGVEDAQDACQEVWLRVWRSIGNFRGESAFTTWLYKITVNTCLSARRKDQSVKLREFGGEFPQLPVQPGGEDDPEASVLNGERRDEIFHALERVRAEHRAALVLRHMEGLSYAEVASILDVPDGTAKGWVSRGRAALLVALAEETPNGDRGEEAS